MSGSVTPIVALDVGSIDAALQIIEDIGELCSFYKIGSELYTAEGPAIVRAVQAAGASVFLDLKFHDIPNTVRGAVRAAASLGTRLLTVHASGGGGMLEAAVEGAHDVGPGCEILAVTVLTSLDSSGLSQSWGRPIPDVRSEVNRLAALALDAGAHGVVCSGHEATSVRQRFGDSLAILVPGVRLAGAEHQDQARVVTPGEAARAGARYIVLGRTVTAAETPRDAMKMVLSDLP